MERRPLIPDMDSEAWEVHGTYPYPDEALDAEDPIKDEIERLRQRDYQTRIVPGNQTDPRTLLKRRRI